MATKDDTDMVMAHGDNGLGLTPRSKVVEVPVLQFAPGNRPIPVTIRALQRGAPVRLIGIARKGLPWPYLSWRDADGSPGGCYVRNVVEARDALFDSLSPRSQRRIVAAVASVR